MSAMNYSCICTYMYMYMHINLPMNTLHMYMFMYLQKKNNEMKLKKINTNVKWFCKKKIEIHNYMYMCMYFMAPIRKQRNDFFWP